jgi:hypothetical protein
MYIWEKRLHYIEVDESRRRRCRVRGHPQRRPHRVQQAVRVGVRLDVVAVECDRHPGVNVMNAVIFKIKYFFAKNSRFWLKTC